MGSIADYYIELGQNQGWSPFGSRPYVKSGASYTCGHDVTCKKCGAKRLKWRAVGAGWRLFHEERGDRNEKLEHQCSAATPSDFEALE